MQSKKMKLFTKDRVVSRAAILFMVFTLFACSGGVDDKQSVEAAKQYLEKKQLREARLELKNALQSNSENAEARYLLGLLNMTIGDMAGAAKDFRKASQSGWDESQAQIGLMRAYVKSNDFKKVIADMQIKESYPENARADLYGIKAFALAASGDIEQAKQLVAKGEAIDANAFQILKTSIQLKLTASDEVLQKEAEAQFKSALSLYENNVELLLLGAFAAIQGENTELAAEYFQKVLSMEPANLVTFNGRSARLGLARLEIMDKNFDQANSFLMPLFKQSENDPEANYIGAMLAFEQGEYELAEGRLLRVFKFAPEHPKSQLLFGAVNFAQKDYEQASYYIGKYLSRDPGNIAARKLLGKTYLLMGQHEEAQAILKQDMKEDDAELLALIGMSQLKSGDIASGLSDLKRAVDAAPDSQLLRGELAKAYITAGETENAIKQLNTILAEGGNRNQAEILKVSAYLRDRQFNQAINLALEMHERSPQDPAVLSMVGNVFAVSGDRAEARKYFSKARVVDPDYILATMLLAALEELDGNLEQAEGLYLNIEDKEPSSIDHLLALARLAEKQGDQRAMVNWLEKARQKMSSDIRSRLVLAEYYLRKEQHSKLEPIVKEVVDISPNDPRVLVLQGRVLMMQQRYNEALVPLNKLVTLETRAIIGRTMLGECYMRLGQINDARRQVELALQINEFDVAALLLMTNIQLADKQFNNALIYSKKAQKVKPDFYMGFELEGNARMAVKNYSAAQAAFTRAIRLQPSSSLAIKLSGVMVQMDQLEQAKQPLMQWLSKNPDDVKVRQHLGGIYQSLNENSLAINEFKFVIQAEPENVVALNNLAWLYALEKNPAAVDIAEKVYSLLPANPGIQDTYGWVLVVNGQVDKGLLVLEQAIKGLPDVAEVQYHYAAALAKSGETIKAKKLLTQLLKSQKSFAGKEDARFLLQSL